MEDLPIAGAPVPMVQLGIGLIKNTDLKIRYGQLNDDEEGYAFDLLGIGIMHDFKQWIPGIKALPIDMSVFAGWSRFKTEISFNETFPGELTINNGLGTMEASTLTVQALISKKLSILTPYFGIGYNAVSSSFKVDGEFIIEQLRNPITNEAYVMTDPVDFTYDGGSGLRTTLGLRIKLAIITLHADYTIQKYNVFGVGFGLAVR